MNEEDDDKDVMERHSVNEEDDDDIESGSTSSLNSDTDSNDLLVPDPGPDPDDLGDPRWGREHYIRYFPSNLLSIRMMGGNGHQ